jgi:hypothetical protein
MNVKFFKVPALLSVLLLPSIFPAEAMDVPGQGLMPPPPQGIKLFTGDLWNYLATFGTYMSFKTNEDFTKLSPLMLNNLTEASFDRLPSPERLANFGSLKSLKINEPLKVDERCEGLSGLTNLTQLECSGYIWNIGALTKLRTLQLENACFYGSNIAFLTNLTYLNGGKSDIPDAWVKPLRQLRTLHSENWQFEDDSDGEEPILGLTNLQELNVKGEGWCLEEIGETLIKRGVTVSLRYKDEDSTD